MAENKDRLARLKAVCAASDIHQIFTSRTTFHTPHLATDKEEIQLY